jgi:hypothetical protein
VFSTRVRTAPVSSSVRATREAKPEGLRGGLLMKELLTGLSPATRDTPLTVSPLTASLFIVSPLMEEGLVILSSSA